MIKPMLVRRPWVLVCAVTIAAISTGAPAEAKKKPPPPVVHAPLPPPPIPGVDSGTQAAIDRFVTRRGAHSLWLAGGATSPAALMVIDRLRTSAIDGYASGPSLAAHIERSLASPAGAAEAERSLSAAYVMLVRQLTGPGLGLRYTDPAARPKVRSADEILAIAASSTDFDHLVRTSLRRSDVYEQLRAAILASTASGTPVDPRLLSNLERARVLPPSGRALVVNPATAELWMMEDGRVRDSMRVVVGTIETPTAPMASTLSYVTANPYWNVPSDLVQKIVAPRITRQGVSYLKRARYEVVDRFGPDASIIAPTDVDWKAVVDGKTQVSLRQLPGPYNSMGRMKFGFPNDLGIFLHDTPNKPQFANARRTDSNGCVRLEDAPRLARWLLGDEPRPNGTAGDQHIALPKPVPVFIAYLTAMPSASGIQWAEDVYRLDPQAPTGPTLVQAAAGPVSAN